MPKTEIKKEVKVQQLVGNRWLNISPPMEYTEAEMQRARMKAKTNARQMKGVKFRAALVEIKTTPQYVALEKK